MRTKANKGEIYFASLNPSFGHEQGGTRPVLIMSDERLAKISGICMAVPGMRGEKAKRNHALNIRVPAGIAGLPLETVFMIIQMRALDIRRLNDSPIGILPEEYVLQAEQAIIRMLDIKHRRPE